MALLAFGPHPDDVELSCGGWLALAARQGQSVAIVDLSRGELATHGTVAERAEEATAAAHVLGVSLRENLGLPDGGLSAEDDAQVAALAEAVRRHRPELVLAPHVHARHPDHEAAGRLARRAVFLAGLRNYRPELGEPHRPRRLVHYPQRHEVRADFVVDIGIVVALKHEAVACHRSQFDARPGAESTLINQPLGVQAFAVRDRYWGASIGVEHGEPYLLGGPVPLADPVDHFRRHPSSPLLVPVR